MMRKRYFLIGILGVFLISIFLVLSFSDIGTTKTINEYGQWNAYDCVKVVRSSGAIEDLGCKHNLITNAGKEALEQILFNQVSYGNFTYIGLCNLTAGCTPAATDTTIDNAFAGSGLGIVAGTYNSLGTGNASVYVEFTATANNLVTNTTGLTNQSGVGYTLMALNTFTDVTLQSNDKLAINKTIWIS